MVGLLTATMPLTAGDKVASADVVFDHPEKFTDANDSLNGTEKGRAAILQQIREYVLEETVQLLAPGQQLTITFTDIDLAGSYLPSATSGRDIRVMKDIYPPRMKFAYKVTDASGKLLKEGQENLSNLTYLNTPGFPRGEELFFDKALLGDWLRSTLKH
jgi:hypothetical protein